MEEVRQIQDDAVSSNGINSGNILNNLTQWDVSNMATPAFNEIYDCSQDDDDDDVLPFEGLLDKPGDVNSATTRSVWTDSTLNFAPSNSGNSNSSLDRNDLPVIKNLDVTDSTASLEGASFSLEPGEAFSSFNEDLAMLNKSVSLSEKSSYIVKMTTDGNVNRHVVFLNTPRIVKQPEMSQISRTSFENCTISVKSNFTSDLTCFDSNSENQNLLYNTSVETDATLSGGDCSSQSVEVVSGNLSIADALCVNGTSELFGRDDNSSSYLDHSNANDSSQYRSQLVYADISGSTGKDSNAQNASLTLNSKLSRSQQDLSISSEAASNLLFQQQQQSKTQVVQQPNSIPLNQQFILQHGSQVVSPQFQPSLQVFQQLKFPQQIIRTSFSKNIFDNSQSLLSGHLTLNRPSLDDSQGTAVLVGGQMKQTKPSRTRNQTSRSNRTDTTITGKPNTGGPTSEKDSQELERVMNILKHYKQQIASNDQESQFLPCKRKRSKPPECTVGGNLPGTNSYGNNTSQNKLVSSAVIPNLNLSFSLPIKPTDSRADGVAVNFSFSQSLMTKALSSTDLYSSDQQAAVIFSTPLSMPVCQSSQGVTTLSNNVNTFNTLATVSSSITAIKSSQPSLHPSAPDAAVSRTQILLNSLQQNNTSTLQFSIKTLKNLVASQAPKNVNNVSNITSTAPNEILQTSEQLQSLSKMLLPASNPSVRQVIPSLVPSSSSQQQFVNASQALLRLPQLNSNQKLGTSPQQVLINSLLQKNWSQLLQLSAKQVLGASSNPSSSQISQVNEQLSAPPISTCSNSMNQVASTSQHAAVHSSLDNHRTFSIENPEQNTTLVSKSSNVSNVTCVASRQVAVEVESNLPHESPFADQNAPDGKVVSVAVALTSADSCSAAHSCTTADANSTTLSLPFMLQNNKVKLELNRKLKSSPVNKISLQSSHSLSSTKSQELQTWIVQTSCHGIENQKVPAEVLDISKDDEGIPKKGGCLFQKIVSTDVNSCLDSFEKGAWLSSLENYKTYEDIRCLLQERFKVDPKAIRIEKLQKSGSRSSTCSWDPTSKSILKRANTEEKLLCLVSSMCESYDSNLRILGLVVWEALKEESINTTFDSLSTLIQMETDRKRKSRHDKPSNSLTGSYNITWDLENETCDIRTSSFDCTSKLRRIKQSCESVSELAREVSNVFSLLTSERNLVTQDLNERTISRNIWKNATMLSNNHDDNNTAREEQWDVCCYVPLSHRISEDSFKSKKDLGIWRVFPSCILTKYEEYKDKRCCSQSKNRGERRQADLTSDIEDSYQLLEEPFTPCAIQKTFCEENELCDGEQIKLKEELDANEDKHGLANSWNEGIPSERRKRKCSEIENTLKLKIKKLSGDENCRLRKNETTTEIDEETDQPRQQRYYCVRPRRQKSQKQIENEELQQQKLTRTSSSRTRQRIQQHKIEEDSISDNGQRGAQKTRNGSNKTGKNSQEDVKRSTSKDTRTRLTMKLRDKISPRMRYNGGVFMALTQGSIYFEVSNSSIYSTSLTNCSTSQICLKLQSRQILKSEFVEDDNDEEKVSCIEVPNSISSDDESVEALQLSQHVPHNKNFFSQNSNVETSFHDGRNVHQNEAKSLPTFLPKSEEMTTCSLLIPSPPTPQVSMTHLSVPITSPFDDGMSTTASNFSLSLTATDSDKLDCQELQHMSFFSALDDKFDELVKNIKSSSETPVNCATTMTTDTLITKWIKPKLATTGPYQCWD